MLRKTEFVWKVRALKKCLGGKWYFYLCGKCGFSEDSLLNFNNCLWEIGWMHPVLPLWKLRLTKMPWWKVILPSISVEKAGCRKIPWWNVNRWLWEAGWKLPVQSLCKVWAPKKCLGGKWYLYVSLWKVWALRKFLDKLQQTSLGSWMKAFCSISVDTAGSWKCLDVNKNCVDMHKWVPLWIIQHHFAMTVLSTHVQAS